MKNSKALVCVLVIMAMVFSFVGCGPTTPTKVLKTPVASVSDIYAFSCMSTAELLTTMSQPKVMSKVALMTRLSNNNVFFMSKTNDMINLNDASNETGDSLENQIKEVNSYLAMFEGMLSGKSPIETTITQNAIYKDVTYTSCMKIEVKNLDGTVSAYEFYFNETVAKVEAPTEEEPNPEEGTTPEEGTPEEETPEEDTTPEEGTTPEEPNPEEDATPEEEDDVIDENEREEEIETELSGIMICNGVEYIIEGKKEIETEEEDGKIEKEFKITFIATDANKNSIKVVQSVEEEEGEKEQKFTFEMRDADGNVVNKSVLQMEVEDGEVEIELELEDKGVVNRYRFEREGDEINIHYTNAEGKEVVCTVTITTDADGKTVYTYTFPDGHKQEEDKD
ncbi:MAG: hypothetical protein RR054_03540 [Clostridia bacterium]